MVTLKQKHYNTINQVSTHFKFTMTFVFSCNYLVSDCKQVKIGDEDISSNFEKQSSQLIMATPDSSQVNIKCIGLYLAYSENNIWEKVCSIPRIASDIPLNESSDSLALKL